MTLDLDAIEAAAKAATQGARLLAPIGGARGVDILAWVDPDRGLALAGEDGQPWRVFLSLNGNFPSRADVEYIAATDPSTVLALVARARLSGPSVPLGDLLDGPDDGADVELEDQSLSPDSERELVHLNHLVQLRLEIVAEKARAAAAEERLAAAEALLVAALSTCEAHLGDKRCGAPSTSGWWDYEAPTGGYDQRCDEHRPLPEDDRGCCRRPREDHPYAPQLRAWLALRGDK